jgi:hypothetical protein
MKVTHAERRQIENEMIFRRTNEQVGDDLAELDAMHIEDGDIDLITEQGLVLHFMCECSDENCEVRIPLLLIEYQHIHTDRDTFIVIPDHQVDPIETVIKKTKHYNVVKKHNSVAEPEDELNATTINNS